jgi:hypothetical protein
MELPLFAVEPTRKSICFSAQITSGELVISMTLKLGHTAIFDMRDDSATIRAIERT